jgi:hypothetical protein
MSRIHGSLVAVLLGLALPALPLVASAAAPATALKPVAPQPLKTEFVFTAYVKVAAPIVIGKGADGLRRYVPITGGEVQGPLLKGTVLAAGGDLQVFRTSDDVLALEATYILESDDGVKISVVNSGYRHGPAAVIARMARGESVAPGEYYFRTSARLDAPRGSKYEWVNKTLFISTAERQADLVIVHFYQVL